MYTLLGLPTGGFTEYVDLLGVPVVDLVKSELLRRLALVFRVAQRDEVGAQVHVDDPQAPVLRLPPVERPAADHDLNILGRLRLAHWLCRLALLLPCLYRTHAFWSEIGDVAITGADNV